MYIWRGILYGVIIAAALSLIVLFSRTYDYHRDIIRLDRDMINLEERVGVKAGNWVHYLESRVNRVAQSQDEYQASTSRRIDLFEDRVRRLESDIRKLQEQTKITKENK